MAKKKKEKDPRKIVATNRKALSKFEIIESMEAGMVLTGPEVKSLRAGAANLHEGFVRIIDEEVFLWNVHISPYSQGSLHVEQVPTRTRKLLMGKSEIKKWMGKTMTKGFTIVPLEIYFNKKGKAKIRIALARGKKTIDRRDDIKRRTIDREMRRQFAGKQKIK